MSRPTDLHPCTDPLRELADPVIRALNVPSRWRSPLGERAPASARRDRVLGVELATVLDQLADAVGEASVRRVDLDGGPDFLELFAASSDLVARELQEELGQFGRADAGGFIERDDPER